MLVDYETIRAGWELTSEGMCKIPGVGPVDPQDVKAVAHEAFINAVVLEGKDLRHFKRFSRHVPPEIKVALELGKAPDFDGPVCGDCGNRFRPEFDHSEPVVAGGPTSYLNLEPKCDPCHVKKTEADRRAGKLTPRPPPDAGTPGKGPPEAGPTGKGQARKGPRSSSKKRASKGPRTRALKTG